MPADGYCGEQSTNPCVLKVTCCMILRRTIHNTLRFKSYLLKDIAANNPQISGLKNYLLKDFEAKQSTNLCVSKIGTC
jgi:hypothetical protein